MSKKYVIELDDHIKLVASVGVTESGVVYTTSDYVNYLEELNSDYINEHYGSLQDEAYRRGLNDGSLDVKQRVEGAYQRGLEDAWKAVKKIALMDTKTSENVTGYFGLFRIMENLTPMQAIEKLKAYEYKQKEKGRIEVGDEAKWNSDVIVITRVYEDGGFNWCDGISQDGRAFHVLAENVRKTGKHYDIQSILEAMRK